MERAGGRARSRSPRGPEPWRGAAPGPGLGGLPASLTPCRGYQGPTAGKPPRGPSRPSPSHSLKRPRDAMAREETPRNKETRRRRWRARGASGRAPSSPLPACRKVDGLEDEMPGSRARPRPGARDPTPPAAGALGAALTPGPGPASVTGALRLPGRPAGSRPGWRRYLPPPRPLPHSACWRGQSSPRGVVGCPESQPGSPRPLGQTLGALSTLGAALPTLRL